MGTHDYGTTRIDLRASSVSLITGAEVVTAQGLEDCEVRGTILRCIGRCRGGRIGHFDGTGLIGGPRKVMSDERGAYRFAALLPEEAIRCVSKRRLHDSPAKRIVLLVATTATIDIQLTVSQVQQMVDVAAHGQVIDVRSSAIVTTLDEHLLQSLPTIDPSRMSLRLHRDCSIRLRWRDWWWPSVGRLEATACMSMAWT